MADLIASPLVGPLLIFLLRMTDVSLATVRILLIHRNRAVVPIIGFVEVMIWVMAVGATVQNLTSPLHVFAFASGFAAGNYLGIRIEERMALGLAVIRAVVKDEGTEVAEFLRAAGFGVTEIAGRGRNGPVRVLDIALPRRQARRCMDLIEEEMPGAFVVLEEPRSVHHGFLKARRG